MGLGLKPDPDSDQRGRWEESLVGTEGGAIYTSPKYQRCF